SRYRENLGMTRFRRDGTRCERIVARKAVRMAGLKTGAYSGAHRAGFAREHAADEPIYAAWAAERQVYAGDAHPGGVAALHGGDSAVGEVFRAEAAGASAAAG